MDYLTKPIEVFKEMHRVLKPGGQAIMSFSNRCFPTKGLTILLRYAHLQYAWAVRNKRHLRSSL